MEILWLFQNIGVKVVRQLCCCQCWLVLLLTMSYRRIPLRNSDMQSCLPGKCNTVSKMRAELGNVMNQNPGLRSFETRLELLQLIFTPEDFFLLFQI